MARLIATACCRVGQEKRRRGGEEQDAVCNPRRHRLAGQPPRSGQSATVPFAFIPFYGPFAERRILAIHFNQYGRVIGWEIRSNRRSSSSEAP